MTEEEVQAKLAEFEELQERIAGAQLELCDMIMRTAEHAGFSPAKKLRERIINLLDGKTAEGAEKTDDDEENDDGES